LPFSVRASQSSREIGKLDAHSDEVSELSWNPSHSHQLATASMDKSVRVWDARTAKSAQTIKTVEENLRIAWHPSRNCVAVLDHSDSVNVYDLRRSTAKSTPSSRLTPPATTYRGKSVVNQIRWTASGEHLLLTTRSGKVKVLSFSAGSIAATASSSSSSSSGSSSGHAAEATPTLAAYHSFRAHPDEVWCVDVDPSGARFAVGSDDASFSIWRAADVVCEGSCAVLEHAVHNVAFSHDGDFIAAAGEDATIAVVRVATRAVECTLDVTGMRDVLSLAWHPKKHALAYCGSGGGSRGGISVVVPAY
jgi:THO complex subunit 3